MATLLLDLRHTVRAMRRTPLLLSAALSLAVAIGAWTMSRLSARARHLRPDHPAAAADGPGPVERPHGSIVPGRRRGSRRGWTWPEPGRTWMESLVRPVAGTPSGRLLAPMSRRGCPVGQLRFAFALWNWTGGTIRF
jgi:hypothetical protein